MDTTASASPAAAAPRFVHLRLHSEYSVQDGIVRLDDAVKRAAKDRMPAVALTDLANLFGMIKFYKAARSAGVKPVVGVDVWISNEADRDKPYRMLLLAADRAGYGRLCDLLTRAYLQNKHRGRAELKREWLLEPGAAGGLIALSGALGGDVGQALVSGNHALAGRLAREWAGAFPDAYYLELQRAGHPQSEAQVQAACTLASELDLPVVATHPVQFMDAADYKAHEVRVCIAQGYVLADRRRPREYTDQQYFKSQAEMAELFADIPEALENSVEIAQRCNIVMQLGKNFLPAFPTPPGMSLDEFLIAQAREGLETRLAELYPDPEVRAARRPEYEARLKFECDTIAAGENNGE